VQTRPRRHHSRRTLPIALAVTLALSLLLAACGSSSKNSASGGSGDGSSSVTLRLGYFPNVTHAPAIIGVQDGTFAGRTPRSTPTRRPTAASAWSPEPRREGRSSW